MRKHGPKGSLGVKFTALQHANDPSLDTVDALLNTGYMHVDITHAKRKVVSRQKSHFKKDEKKNWKKLDQQYYIIWKGKSKPSSGNGDTFTSVSSLTDPEILDDGDKDNFRGSLQQGSKATTCSSSLEQPLKGKCTLSKREKILVSKAIALQGRC